MAEYIVDLRPLAFKQGVGDTLGFLQAKIPEDFRR
jgi:hypothetical protein